MSTLADLAAENFVQLAANKYPGRIVFAGTSSWGAILQGLIITVRSKPNQNRVLVPVPEPNPNNEVGTEFADPVAAHGVDPTNILYLAMSEDTHSFITSNGQHTAIIYSTHRNLALADGLMQAGWRYEEDSATTPRIAVRSWIGLNNIVHTQFAVLKKSLFDDSVVANNFRYDNIPSGFGFYISTYEHDGNPPPPFVGEPRLIPLIGSDLADITDSLWNAMSRDYRVAIAVKEIDPKTFKSCTHIVNRFPKAPTEP